MALNEAAIVHVDDALPGLCWMNWCMYRDYGADKQEK